MVELTLKQAIDNTIIYELRSNRNCILISSEIGNIFNDYKEGKVTDIKISEERLIEVPDSEYANMGTAVGLALNGLNVIIEVDGTKNLIRCLDPIVNYITKLNVSEKQNMGSLLIKCPMGYKPYASAANSDCMESVIAHFPGINVICPSNAYDAIGLIREAFKTKEPVVLFEDRNLLDKKFSVDENTDIKMSLGESKILREGDDITVVSYGAMLNEALKAAEVATITDIKVEVIDLASIKPLDIETVINSVKKTGRLIVLSESYKFASIGSEIVSQVIESEAFDYLEAPIARLGNDNMLLPYNPQDLKGILPSSGKVLEKITEIVKY